jgi:hypothetical protein
LSSSTSAVSRARTQIRLSPLRLPFRHARIAGSLIAVGSVFRLFFLSFFPLGFFPAMLMKWSTASGGFSLALICTLPPMMMVCVRSQDRFTRKSTILSPARLPFHHSGTRVFIDNQHWSGIQEQRTLSGALSCGV